MKKLKTAIKIKTGATLRPSLKMFDINYLGVSEAASAIDAGIQKKAPGSVTTTLVISIE